MYASIGIDEFPLALICVLCASFWTGETLGGILRTPSTFAALLGKLQWEP